MKKLKQLWKVAITGMLLVCSYAGLQAQSQPQGTGAGRISESVRTVSYPVGKYGNEVMPDWDRGYVIHREIGENYSSDTPMVAMYDKTGKLVLEGRIWPSGARSVKILRTAATKDGAILAGGGAVLKDGSTPGYIAKTDLSGNTRQSQLTGSFKPAQICEAPDGTIWSLGRSLNPNDGQEHDTNILRHFSFEKGLLHRYLPEDTVKARFDSEQPWFSPFVGSYLRCGKDKISVYLNFTDEYVEVDTSSFKLTRWMLDESAVQHEKAEGFAITENGNLYAHFSAHATRRPAGLWGLYQIKAKSGNSIAGLIPVAGSISFDDGKNRLPSGTIVYLWGADGNQLVVWRVDEREMSWVDVIGGEATD
ncbi:MAG TPA: hypothetical protein VJO16_09250 [Candidatus Acidoferrum sp.]|nr:hypothetical protein [Candidatus Acidoferrum sp.]